MREAWHVLEPAVDFVGGWHIDAMCDHLEALSRGTLGRQHLAFNVPPGSMKSLLVSVFLNAWEWGPRGLAHLRYLTGSYEEGLALRDNRKTRRLVESPWYQARWGVPLTKAGDELFENAHGGSRWARAFNSMTGGRGNRVVIDDPHSTVTAESDTVRKKTTTTFREAIMDRLNDPRRDPIILVMQRLHTNDVTGVIDELGLDFEKVVIPMEYDPKRAKVSSIGWSDPRTTAGELMCPERWDEAAVAKMKVAKGSYAYAGQYDQSPSPREGALIKRAWLETNPKLDAAAPGTVWVRGWDLAATKLDATDMVSPRTAGVKLGREPSGRIVIGHATAKGLDEVKAANHIKAIARLDGFGVVIDVPQDPGQAGKVQKRSIITSLAGWEAYATPETGDKVTRAEPFAIQCEAGNVWLLNGAWNKEYIDEVCSFPGGARKDLMDATSRAFARLMRLVEGGSVDSEGLGGPEALDMEDGTDEWRPTAALPSLDF